MNGARANQGAGQPAARTDGTAHDRSVGDGTTATL